MPTPRPVQPRKSEQCKDHNGGKDDDPEKFRRVAKLAPRLTVEVDYTVDEKARQVSLRPPRTGLVLPLLAEGRILVVRRPTARSLPGARLSGAGVRSSGVGVLPTCPTPCFPRPPSALSPRRLQAGEVPMRKVLYILGELEDSDLQWLLVDATPEGLR